MMIVFSDGSPSDCAPGTNPAAMLKHAIKTCTKRGVELYGIGIQDDAVRHFYGECKVVTDEQEFDQALLHTIKNALVRP